MDLAKKSFSLLTMLVAAIALSAGPAAADWDEGDGHKMHWPQLPDPNGWDVDFSSPHVLADDWRCSQSGPVSDIHFWFSAKSDQPFIVDQIHVSIHADIPAQGDDYSTPLNPPLWERDFSSSQFSIRPYGGGDQGWYDPYEGTNVKPDHKGIWQANIVGIENPFYQVEGTIYWLDLSVLAHDPSGVDPVALGWKTSISDHFNDDAVWGEGPIGGEIFWHELRDPLEPTLSLDLAFVITP